MSPPRQRLFTKVSGWRAGTPGREVLLELIGGRQLRAQRAFWGFEILGETARDVVPDLMRTVTQGDIRRATTAIVVLTYLGSNGIQPLLSVSTNTALPLSIRVRRLTSLTEMCLLALHDNLEEFRPAARASVPELTKLLNDPDASLRLQATNALEFIAPEVLRQESAP